MTPDPENPIEVAMKAALGEIGGHAAWTQLMAARSMLWRGDLGFKLCEKCGSHTMQKALEPLGFCYAEAMLHPPAEVYFVCRNPYSRAVASWWDMTHAYRDLAAERIKRWGDESFPAYVRDLTQREPPSPASIHQTQTAWIGDTELEGFIKLEELDTELPRLVPDLEAVPRYNATGHREWRDYYDINTAQMITEWAAGDFERFGYPRFAP